MKGKMYMLSLVKQLQHVRVMPTKRGEHCHNAIHFAITRGNICCFRRPCHDSSPTSFFVDFITHILSILPGENPTEQLNYSELIPISSLLPSSSKIRFHQLGNAAIHKVPEISNGTILIPSHFQDIHKDKNKQFVKVVMGITAVVAAIVIWHEYPNIKPRISPERHGLFGKVPFCAGVMLILYCFWFSIIGILVLANSLFKLPTVIRLGMAASLQGFEDEDYEESKRKTKIITRMLCTMIIKVALLCPTCSGKKLAISPIKESGLYALTVSIGVATLPFGIIYFISVRSLW